MTIKLNPFGVKGIPDRLVLLPGARVIFCEVKRPQGGRLSEHQAIWLRRLHAMGFETAVVATADHIKRLLDGENHVPAE